MKICLALIYPAVGWNAQQVQCGGQYDDGPTKCNGAC